MHPRPESLAWVQLTCCVGNVCEGSLAWVQLSCCVGNVCEGSLVWVQLTCCVGNVCEGMKTHRLTGLGSALMLCW